jgi:branched-chain amino acid aminotransferase
MYFMSLQDAWVNINGEFYRGDEAKISVYDRSFIYGDGFYEGIPYFEQKLVNLEPHLDRLYRSAKYMKIEIPISRDELKQRVIETASRTGGESGYVRLIISRGQGPPGVGSIDGIDQPNICVLTRPGMGRSIEAAYTDPEPIKARIASTRQVTSESLEPRVKDNNYLLNILANLETRGTDADVSILLDKEGNITEADVANLFVVKDERLLTPPKQKILAGITRQSILEVTEAEDILDPVEVELTPYDLYTASECFISNAMGGIQPIIEVNDRRIGEGAVGEKTKTIGAALADLVLSRGIPID